MKNKTQELIEALKNNPDRELIFLYPDECSDHSYTLGYPSRILVDEYYIDGERVWLKHDNADEMFDHYADIIADIIFDELYPNEPYANDEQEEIINKKTEEFINGLDWKKCICVFIHY